MLAISAGSACGTKSTPSKTLLQATFAPKRRSPNAVFTLMDQCRAKDSPVSGTSATVSRLPRGRDVGAGDRNLHHTPKNALAAEVKDWQGLFGFHHLLGIKRPKNSDF